MRPYPGSLTLEQINFNYRLSRARRTIENAFGINMVSQYMVENFVLACLDLNNYLRLIDNASYCPSGFIDSYDSTGNLREGKWRTLAIGNEGMLPINRVKGSRYSKNAIEMRNSLLLLFDVEMLNLSWVCLLQY